jgi:uncharacterized protein YjbI with pentapeptide repeats
MNQPNPVPNRKQRSGEAKTALIVNSGHAGSRASASRGMETNVINHPNRGKRLLKFSVLNRFSGEVQFTADIDCKEDESTSVKLGLAVRWAIDNGARLDGASLDGARLDRACLDRARLDRASLDRASLVGARLDRASLDRACLVGARLDRASLDRASLVGASLDRASLDRASLVGARLDGASLVGARLDRASLVGARLDGASLGNGQWVVQGPVRDDGYAFMLTCFRAEGVRVKAGCRNFTVEEATAHWDETRPVGDPLGDETRMIIAHMMELARLRGYDLTLTAETFPRVDDATLGAVTER